jgi:cyclic pyranopterin phosphate synthase
LVTRLLAAREHRPRPARDDKVVAAWNGLAIGALAEAGVLLEEDRYLDGAGEIGVISSVTQPFCSTCTRARLSADGKLYTCLFAIRGTDFRAPLREGATDEQIGEILSQVWRRRTDRYSELRSAKTVDLPKVEMSYIGG